MAKLLSDPSLLPLFHPELFFLVTKKCEGQRKLAIFEKCPGHETLGDSEIEFEFINSKKCHNA